MESLSLLRCNSRRYSFLDCRVSAERGARYPGISGADAGKAHISVLSVMSFDEIKDKLLPKFAMSSADELNDDLIPRYFL